MPFVLFNTIGGPIAASREHYFAAGSVQWDDLLNIDNLHAYLDKQAQRTKHIEAPGRLLAPIGSQEIWGACVTYFRSGVACVSRISPCRHRLRSGFRSFTMVCPSLKTAQTCPN
jgi:hypothetical protein